MPAGPFTALLRLLRGASKTDASDRQLLARFVANADEAAFAGLVDRYGRLVFHLCRSVLHQEQDAEDAFQATFLVLARSAASIRNRDSLASWLHGVALRTALKARQARAKRHRTEPQASVSSPPGPVSEAALREVQAIFHEEVERLAVKYRTPFVLCCLEGKSRAEAAQQLGWKDGTISGRIAQARALLQVRLARRGVALPAALAAAALLPDLGTACVPAVVSAALAFAAGSASRPISPVAATLAQGVLQAMLITKLKTIAAVMVILAVVLVGGGWLACAAWQTDEGRQAGLAGKAPRTDSYGDPLPPDALVRLGTVRLRHGSSVSFLDFTADGKTIVYTGPGGVDNVVRVVDASTGKERQSFVLKPAEPLFEPIGPPHGRPTLSPDGKMLAIAWSDGRTWNEPEKIKGTVIVWDTMTGKEIRRINCAGIPSRPVFSPDSKILLTLEKGQLHTWDAATGKKIRDFNDFTGKVGQPIFSADGKLLALDRYLKSRAEPRAVLFVDTTTWKQARPAVALKDFTASYANLHGFSPDGKLLVGDDATGHLIFWEAATGKLIERVLADDQATPSSITSVSFSPDATMLAVVVRDGRVTVWDVARRKVLHKIEGAYGTAVFSPRPIVAGKGPLLATGSNGPALRFWDPSTAKEVLINDAPFSPVQMTFWLPGDKVLAVYPAEKGYRLWDSRSGKQLAKVTTSDRYIWWAVASPDGRFLAISNWRGQVGDDVATHLFDLRTGKELPRLGPQDFIGSRPIRFTSDGRFLIASEVVKGATEPLVENRMVMWDTVTGKVTGRPPDLDLKKMALQGGVNRSAASADGKSLLLEMAVIVPPPPEITEDRGGHFEQEYYWCGVDVATGKLRWRTDQVKQTDALAISANGKIVACGIPGKVELRSGDTGALLRVLDCHTKYPRPWSYGQLLAFTSDGKRFIATDAGTNAYVWDVATGKELHQFAGHRGRILSVSISPDDTMFATSSEDSTVLLWPLDRRLKDAPEGAK